ncbi:MAG: hypothetical protein Q7T76_14035 [Ferruginibacter sp.]|nr:hypothetical protein [Ferruginibacter sp.]
MLHTLSDLLYSLFAKSFNSSHSPPHPAGLRHCNAAAFASLKNLAALDVFNADFVVTEPKEAAYATTGDGNAASICAIHLL